MSQTDRVRITKGNNSITELALSPYFSIINVQLVDINLFVKSDENPSLPVQVIKKKPKRCGLIKNYKGNNSE